MNANIVIVGAGPVGKTLALCLAQQTVGATLLEARAQGAAYPDGRALALSYGTKMILDRLGVWDHIQKITAIETIHISQKGSLGRTRLKAQEHDLPALGYVVSYGALSAALDMVLDQQPDIAILYETEATAIKPQVDHTLVSYKTNDTTGEIKTQLAVLADGGRSVNQIQGLQRETKAYGHDALVAKVTSTLPHRQIAYERFTTHGPMALLPNGDAFSLVWTGKTEAIQDLLKLEDAAFLQALHQHFGDRVGQFISIGKRMTFPLVMATLRTNYLPHLAVIGNAAQTMHPVAGQGFNIGIRDADALAKHIANSDTAAIGSDAMLSAYANTRQRDTQRGLLFTDFLVNIFSNEVMGLHAMRGTGLGVLDMVKPLKRFVVNKMSYGK